MFHFHKYKRIENPKFSYIDYSGCEVLTAMCICTICGKKKEQKYMGRWRLS